MGALNISAEETNPMICAISCKKTPKAPNNQAQPNPMKIKGINKKGRVNAERVTWPTKNSCSTIKTQRLTII